MNILPRQLCQAAITGSNATVYTVPASTTAFLKCFDVCNTTAGDLTVNVHIVASGGSAGTTNALYYTYTVTAHTTFHWTGAQVMTAGMLLVVKGSSTGMTITASGGEAT